MNFNELKPAKPAQRVNRRFQRSHSGNSFRDRSTSLRSNDSSANQHYIKNVIFKTPFTPNKNPPPIETKRIKARVCPEIVNRTAEQNRKNIFQVCQSLMRTQNIKPNQITVQQALIRYSQAQEQVQIYKRRLQKLEVSYKILEEENKKLKNFEEKIFTIEPRISLKPQNSSMKKQCLTSIHENGQTVDLQKDYLRRFQILRQQNQELKAEIFQLRDKKDSTQSLNTSISFTNSFINSPLKSPRRQQFIESCLQSTQKKLILANKKINQMSLQLQATKRQSFLQLQKQMKFKNDEINGMKSKYLDSLQRYKQISKKYSQISFQLKKMQKSQSTQILQRNTSQDYQDLYDLSDMSSCEENEKNAESFQKILKKLA